MFPADLFIYLFLNHKRCSKGFVFPGSLVMGKRTLSKQRRQHLSQDFTAAAAVGQS